MRSRHPRVGIVCGGPGVSVVPWTAANGGPGGGVPCCIPVLEEDEAVTTRYRPPLPRRAVVLESAALRAVVVAALLLACLGAVARATIRPSALLRGGHYAASLVPAAEVARA